MPSSPLPADALSAVAKQASYHDISIEADYKPPLRDKTWYLLAPGMISRDKNRLFDLMEHRSKNAAPEHDICDYPCYSARTFKSIIKFLLRCPDLEGKFERKASGEMEQTKSIYFVVHGIDAIFSAPIYALRLVEYCNAPRAVILAVATKDEAEQIAATYPPLSAAALEHMEAVKKQAREALRESMGPVV